MTSMVAHVQTSTRPHVEAPARCRPCQKRKVKCGKERPICFNCKRLGLECTKLSRFRWKDLTISTRKSLASVTSERSSVWDPEGSAGNLDHRGHMISASENGMSKNDYQFVDFTPQNYHEMSRSQEKFDHASSIGTITAVPPPGSAVLELFEDYGSRDSIYSRSRQSSVVKVWPFARSTAVSVMSGSTGASLARQLDSTLSLPGLKDHSMFSQASKHTRDLVYFNHYRSVVVYNMQVNSKFPADVRPFCHDPGETDDAFEACAATFRPLYNAMMALSALSMAHRERLNRADSFQYYQHAIEGLRQQTTRESLKVIFTHYFLLLYEIAACERRTNMELNHMQQLNQLLIWYFTARATDPVSVFKDQKCQKCAEITMTCIPSNMLYCDMYNLVLFRQQSTVIPDQLVVGFFNSVHSTEQEPVLEGTFGTDIDFARRTVLLNVMGGWAHRVVRNIVQDVNCSIITEISDLEGPHKDLDEKIKTLNDYCAANAPRMPVDIYDEAYSHMPVQCQTTFDSSQYTVRQLLIYAHTSIFPQQRIRLLKRREEYIQFLAREILYLKRPRWGEARPIAASNLAAIFMCGTVVTKREEKDEVLQVLETMAADASGRNFVRVIDALKELYKEQDRVRETGMDERGVDWHVFLREKGLLDFSLFGI